MNIVRPCQTHIQSDAFLVARTHPQLSFPMPGNDGPRKNRQHRNHDDEPDEALDAAGRDCPQLAHIKVTNAALCSRVCRCGLESLGAPP